jgi:excisionase family DNA binding protein
MERLLDVREVAALVRVSPRTVWNYVAEGRLPKVTLGDKTIRFRPQDVEAFVSSEITWGAA